MIPLAPSARALKDLVARLQQQPRTPEVVAAITKVGAQIALLAPTGDRPVTVTKVGPKGYIHGWIFVGVPGVGDSVHHPQHGRGTVTGAAGGHVSVAFDSGAHHQFETHVSEEHRATGHFQARTNTAGANPADTVIMHRDRIPSMSTADLQAADEQLAHRAEILGKPGQVSKPHQAVKDELQQRQPGAASLPQGQVKVIKKLTGGGSAQQVDLVRDAQGREAVRKTMSDEDTAENDREVAAAVVAHAVGINDLHVRRDNANTVTMTYFHGKTGTVTLGVRMPAYMKNLLGLEDDDDDFDEDDPVYMAEYKQASEELDRRLEEAVRGPGGKQIALLDYLTSNTDRNYGNWIVGDDKMIHPIDHGQTFGDHVKQARYGGFALESPFSKAWLTTRGVSFGDDLEPNELVSPFTKAELQQVKEQLTSGKADIDKLPSAAFTDISTGTRHTVNAYDSIMQRLQWLMDVSP